MQKKSSFILPPMFSNPFITVSLICKSKIVRFRVNGFHKRKQCNLGFCIQQKNGQPPFFSKILILYSCCLIALKIFFIHLFVLWVNAHVVACMWKSEDNWYSFCRQGQPTAWFKGINCHAQLSSFYFSTTRVLRIKLSSSTRQQVSIFTEPSHCCPNTLIPI